MATNVNTCSATPVSRLPFHQLSNGLYVSGYPEDYRDNRPTMTSTAVPYTGGDIRKSGELGKMFDIPVETLKPKKPSSASGHPLKTVSFGPRSSHSGPLSMTGDPRSNYSASGPLTSAGLPSHNSVQSRSGPLTASGMPIIRQASHSGPLTRDGDCILNADAKCSSARSTLKTSGSLSTGGIHSLHSGNLLPVTGLITSGPLSSSGAPKIICSGPLDASGAPVKSINGPPNHAINKLSHKHPIFKRNLPAIVLWIVVPLFLLGFVAGGFILVTVKNAILLIVVGGVCMAVVMLLFWNLCWGGDSFAEFMDAFGDSDLRTAKDGEYVKVTGVVTCGNVPLESSYQKVSRCIYTSSGVYEYRDIKSKPAKSGHRYFTWGLRYLERHVVDFYISDFQSGLRALVKSGNNAVVMPYVEESIVVNASKNKELPADFISWLGERNLSCDDRIMQLKEGCIKEGSTVTIMGVVQRHENVLMIVPPCEPISTGCQWRRLLLPGYMDGLILSCEDAWKIDGILSIVTN